MTNWKSLWCWERLRAAGENGLRGWDGLMASLTQWMWTWQTPGDGKGQGGLCAAVYGVAKSQTWLGDWTTTTTIYFTWTNIWRNYFSICRHNLLYFALQIVFFLNFFNKLTVSGNLTLRKIVDAIFPTPVAHFVFGNSQNISNFFIKFVIVIYNQWISDIWCYY